MAHKRPESVLVLLRSGERFLLLERSDWPGFWQSVTGSLEPGEAPLSTAIRETREEIGWCGAPPVATGRHRYYEIYQAFRPRYPAHVTHNREWEFELQLPIDFAPTLNPREHREWVWLDRLAAAKRVKSWTNRDAISAARSARPAAAQLN